jgi:hypothetical protein
MKKSFLTLALFAMVASAALISCSSDTTSPDENGDDVVNGTMTAKINEKAWSATTYLKADYVNEKLTITGSQVRDGREEKLQFIIAKITDRDGFILNDSDILKMYYTHVPAGTTDAKMIADSTVTAYSGMVNVTTFTSEGVKGHFTMYGDGGDVDNGVFDVTF